MSRSSSRRVGQLARASLVAGTVALVAAVACSSSPEHKPVEQREVGVSIVAHVTDSPSLRLSTALAARSRALQLGLVASGEGFRETTDGLLADGKSAAGTPGGSRFLSTLAPVHAADAIELRLGLGKPASVGVRTLGARNVPAQLDAGRVLYTDAFPSADVIFAARADAAEIFVLLKDANAPSELSWQLDLPSGWSTPALESSGALLFSDASGEPMLRVAKPLAVDARGREVSPALAWADGRLSVALDTRELTFPVLLDPALEAPHWINRTPASGNPADRRNHAMAFDPVRHVTVMFGGESGTADTWHWDGTSWTGACGTATTAACAISARRNHTMTFDVGAGLSLLFGGRPLSGTTVLGDTWTYNGAGTWAMKCDTGACGPAARFGASLANMGAGTSLLFGGNAGVSGDTTLNDTWLWNGSSWSQQQVNTDTPGANQPPGRSTAGMAYDASRNRVVLFGGLASGVFLNDTWEWDGSKWNQLCSTGCTPPDMRAEPVMAYDSKRKRTVLFGGTGASTFGDTWEWDGTTWTSFGTTGADARRASALAFDSDRGRSVLFNGLLASLANGGGTWEYHTHGGGCTLASQCDTGFCVDGVCCDSACNGTCQRCDDNQSGNTPGICASVVSADDGDTCTGTKTCNATSACVLKKGQPCTTGTQCVSNLCVDNTCCADTCPGTCLSCANSAGTCTTPVAQGSADTNATTQCTGNNACDGAGNCKLKTGQSSCTTGTQCASGNCVDGTCCADTCPGQCKSCANSAGTCTTNVGVDVQDTNSTTQCSGANACDGAGNCKLKSGQTCTTGTQCASGNCVDGTCCTTSCTTPCFSCANSAGTCTTPIAKNSTDTVPANACTGNNVCDGAGKCLAKQGQTCTKADGSECASGFCVDGRCCESACTTACKSCANTAGTCTTNVAQFATDTSPGNECVSPNVCDGAGNCKSKQAENCSAADGSTCASGFCVDGKCCDTACSGACDSCSTGTCTKAGGPGSPSCAPYLCSTSSSSCPTTCASNADCTSDHYCSGGACVADQPVGSKCNSSAECIGNTNCVDGVCCDSACGMACQACSAALKGNGVDGTCDNIASGLQPHISNGCPPGGNVCDKDGLCDGKGACRTSAPAGKACGATSCIGNTVTGHTCDGMGLCQDMGTQNCSPYVCQTGSGQCASSCATAADCVDSTFFCSGGVCQLKKPDSAMCANDGECQNGHCVDGVCCESACTEACNSCATGQCLARPAGASGQPSCTPFVCDGNNSGCPTLCNSNANCIAMDFCQTSSNTCVPRVSGSTCSVGDECPSGFCADGVCCDTECKGQCEHCDSTGTCVATTGKPLPGHADCTGDADCAGQCDGTDRTACSAPKDSGTSCGTPSCAANIAHAGSCDGNSGLCTIADTACDPYTCDSNKCKTACTTTADCKVGFVCTAGSCVAPTSSGVCNADNTKATPVGGTESDCAPYVCKDGACLRNCMSSSDCQSGNVCDTTSGQCASLAALNAPASSDKSGCSCRVAGSDTSPGGARSALGGLALCALGALARRRRRHAVCLSIRA